MQRQSVFGRSLPRRAGLFQPTGQFGYLCPAAETFRRLQYGANAHQHRIRGKSIYTEILFVLGF